MSEKVLLTSFDTWLPHQPSNASDDLLVNVMTSCSSSFLFLRRLPVETARASERAVKAIKTLHPHRVICCGMAESRYRLSVESNATWTSDRLETSMDLESLVAQLSYTTISHNAGRFVCEGLYYQVLKYLHPQNCPCVFVHIPVLTATNLPAIIEDFRAIANE